MTRHQHTIPMPPPAPRWEDRATQPAPAPGETSSGVRMTEPPSKAPLRVVLPFRPALRGPGLEPSADISTRPTHPPAAVTPSRSPSSPDPVRAFCWLIVCALVGANMTFWIVLALRPAPTPTSVVAPSLPAVLLAALASSSPERPESLGTEPSALAATPTPLASSALPASTAAAAVASSAPRPERRPSPASKPRSRLRSDLVDPWGD